MRPAQGGRRTGTNAAAYESADGRSCLSLLLAAQPSTATTGGYARPDLLVDTAWLAAHTSDADIRIVDLRPRGYDEGHIPGAVWLDNNWIRNPKAAPDFLPTPAEFEALMAKLGIGHGTRVIAYDERGGIYAARLWWILNYYGHSNVALLNGGWTKWTAEQRATVDATRRHRRAPAPFKVKAGDVGHATAKDVVAAINKPGVKLVDARTQGEIDGKDLRGIKRGRLHRVVRPGLLGRHARQAAADVQAGRRDPEAVSRPRHPAGRRGHHLLPGRHARVARPVHAGPDRPRPRQAPQLLRLVGRVGQPGRHAHQDEALMAGPPGRGN